MAARARKKSLTLDLELLELHAREPLFWLDHDFKFVWVNRAWAELTGRSLNYIQGAVCGAYSGTHSEHPADLAACFRPPVEVSAGTRVSITTHIFRADGAALDRRLDFLPVIDREGKLLGVLGFVRELSDAPSYPRSLTRTWQDEFRQARRRLQERCGFDSIIGSGPAHARLIDQVRLAAESLSPLLIVGESGAGKRHLARVIHLLGPGRDEPLISCDCKALPAEVLEREWFGLSQEGETRGDLAEGLRARLTLRPGSTFLIQEVTSLPRELQARLAAMVKGKARIIVTTSVDPEIAIGDGRLLPALYFAVSPIIARLEPLRVRRDDIPLLAQHFLELANQRGGPMRDGFTDDAMAELVAYDWPGNLRELDRVVNDARSKNGGTDTRIALADLPRALRNQLESNAPLLGMPRPVKSLDEILLEIERRMIETALAQARGNKSRAADLLGISRPRLYRRIGELNLPDVEPAEPESDASEGADQSRPETLEDAREA